MAFKPDPLIMKVQKKTMRDGGYTGKSLEPLHPIRLKFEEMVEKFENELCCVMDMRESNAIKAAIRYIREKDDYERRNLENVIERIIKVEININEITEDFGKTKEEIKQRWETKKKEIQDGLNDHVDKLRDEYKTVKERILFDMLMLVNIREDRTGGIKLPEHVIKESSEEGIKVLNDMMRTSLYNQEDSVLEDLHHLSLRKERLEQLLHINREKIISVEKRLETINEYEDMPGFRKKNKRRKKRRKGK